MSSGHRHGDEKAASAVADKYYDSAAKLVAACTVVDTFDIPWLANRSTDGKTVYRDKRVPGVLKCGIDTSLSLPWHELPEWEAMNDGMLYDTGDPSAHVDVATPLERREVERQKPDDPDIWSTYTDEMDGYIREVDDETIVNVPSDIDLRPFEDDDRALLEKIIAAQEAKRTLYVSRDLTNADDLITWAKDAGFKTTLAPGDMHVTVAFSRAPVDWSEAGSSADIVQISAGGSRSIEKLGDKGALVLRFESSELAARWQQLRDIGASWDWPGYKPHVTLTYDGVDLDLSTVAPYAGALSFGAEKFAEVDENWTDKISEKSAALRLTRGTSMPKIYTPVDLVALLKKDRKTDLHRLFVDDKGARIAKAIGVEASVALAETERAVDFTISTGAIDRYNSTIAVNGWQTANYQKNSVILWAHDDYIPAIGRAETTRIDGGRLVSRAIFATRDVHPLADTIYSLIKAKFINAASVGWIPLKWQFVEDKDRGFGIDYLEQELLEWSVVNIPANPECLVDARSMGIDTKPLLTWAEHTLDTGGMLMIPRKELETLRKAAGASTSVAISRLKFVVDTTELTEALTAVEGLTRAGKAISKKNMDTIKKAHEHASAAKDRCQAACDHLQGMIDQGDDPDEDPDDNGDNQDPEQAALKLRKLRAGLLKLKASAEILGLVEAALAPAPKS